jgi:hypothetical protein
LAVIVWGDAGSAAGAAAGAAASGALCANATEVARQNRAAAALTARLDFFIGFLLFLCSSLALG